MGLPRSRYVKEGEEGVYHCFCRCIRRAFLCGFDKETGRDFSHRKAWLVKRLRFLAAIFAIEVCGYAVMQNHYHLILRVRPDLVAGWSDWEVARRWLTLFPKLGKLKGAMALPLEEEIRALADQPDRIALLRRRLSSLSWFMGRLNEYIARAANKEDEAKGRFWESRFKCQALVDEIALIACMVYVDLNPIRAGIAASPEESDFTSIQERIHAWQRERMEAGSVAGEGAEGVELIDGGPTEAGDPAEKSGIACGSTFLDGWLCPIETNQTRRGILEGMSVAEYIDLVDRSGRVLRPDKRGAIDADLEPILLRIGANPGTWQDTVSRFGSKFGLAAGKLASLRQFAARIGNRWIKGKAIARAAFTS